jgi:hypothetical protein
VVSSEVGPYKAVLVRLAWDCPRCAEGSGERYRRRQVVGTTWRKVVNDPAKDVLVALLSEGLFCMTCDEFVDSVWTRVAEKLEECWPSLRLTPVPSRTHVPVPARLFDAPPLAPQSNPRSLAASTYQQADGGGASTVRLGVR